MRINQNNEVKRYTLEAEKRKINVCVLYNKVSTEGTSYVAYVRACVLHLCARFCLWRCVHLQMHLRRHHFCVRLLVCAFFAYLYSVTASIV